MMNKKLNMLITICFFTVFLSGCNGSSKSTIINNQVIANDVTAPEIIISNLKDNMYVVYDDIYGTIFRNDVEKLRIKAIDDVSGEVDVHVSDNVNYYQDGSYEIIYTAEDSAGNLASKIITVTAVYYHRYPYWTQDEALQFCIHHNLGISQFTDKPSIEKLSSIVEFQCRGNGGQADDTNNIGDFSAFSELKNIKVLDLSGQYGLNSLSFLTNLPKLEKLILKETKGTTDLSALASNKSLKYIDLYFSHMVSYPDIFQYLSNIDKLQYLSSRILIISAPR